MVTTESMSNLVPDATDEHHSSRKALKVVKGLWNSRQDAGGGRSFWELSPF